MKKELSKENSIFALVLFPHRIWGYLMLPYILQKEKSYYKLSESLSPYPNSSTIGNLTNDEREVVNIINEYTDRALFRLFSHDKSVKEFTEKVQPDKVADFIRPFIERRLYKCFTITRDENIPVFHQKKKTQNLHIEDRLYQTEEAANPVFRFVRREEHSTYNLSLEQSGKVLNLKNGQVEILCNNPCVLRESNNILFVRDIEGTKLKPFFSRETIDIPKKSEVRYFSGFVLNTVNNHKVDHSGFEIIEVDPFKEAILDIETGIRGKSGLILQFRYEKNKIYPDDTSASFTAFSNNDDKFIFRKYYRDYSWEEQCIKTLSEIGLFTEDNIHFYPVSTSQSQEGDMYMVIEFVNNNYNEIIGSGFKINSRLDKKFNLSPVTIEMSSQVINDWFDLRAVVKIGDLIIPFTRFRKNISEGIREFILPDGSVFVLPETWFARYKNVFEFGKDCDDSLRVHKQHFSIIQETLEPEERTVLERLERLLVPDKLPVLQKPAGLKCTMRHYQADGLNWLNFLQNAGLGGCLADDMGLGKTVQTLALLQYNKENLQPLTDGNTQSDLFDPVAKLTSLIIVPASLIYNWENEIKRFVPEMKVCVYKGNQRKKTTSYFHNFDILLSSYHTIRQDIDIILTFKFHYIILDESQIIKNPASMLYRTISTLRSEYKLVLTGTPVENSLTDLWTQLNFVNPGILGDLTFFRREFARPIENENDDKQENRLRKIIEPFILRRTKEKVAPDLPPVSEQKVFCDMTDEQYKAYDEEKSSVRNSILKSLTAPGNEKSSIIVLQGLMRLRQLSNHPVLANDDYASGSGKFETVLQDIESVLAEGHKILIFSSFVKHLELYAGELRKRRILFAMLTGASTDREKIVNSFQNDRATKIFLISLRAGGVGLNLTAADYVFLLDPWWNPAAEMQALSRAHRIGQDKNVFVYRYITSNSIEEKIVRLQEKKSKLADTFISSNNPLKDIDIEEILNLIG